MLFSLDSASQQLRLQLQRGRLQNSLAGPFDAIDSQLHVLLQIALEAELALQRNESCFYPAMFQTNVRGAEGHLAAKIGVLPVHQQNLKQEIVFFGAPNRGACDRHEGDADQCHSKASASICQPG